MEIFILSLRFRPFPRFQIYDFSSWIVAKSLLLGGSRAVAKFFRLITIRDLSLSGGALLEKRNK